MLHHQRAKIAFPAHNELYVVDCDSVLYMKADDHYTQVYYQSGEHFLLPFGLSSIEDKLVKTFADECFLQRVGRTYIINTHAIFHINTVKEVVLLTDGSGTTHSIRISKQALRNLMDKINV